MTREGASAHDAGECLMGCPHPDHAFDGVVFDLTTIDASWDDPETMSDEMEPVFL